MATIRKRPGPNGRTVWQVRVLIKPYPPQYRTFDKKAEADAWAASIRSKMKSGAWLERKEVEGTTLSNLLQRYLDKVTPNKKGAAPEAYRINALLRDPIAGMSLAAIRGVDIAGWRDARLKKVAPATVTRDLTILSHVYEVARKEWNLALDNPCRDVRRPTAPKARERRLMIGEEKHLLGACGVSGNTWLRPFVVLALETCMRRSELLALRWEHMDLKHRTARLLDSKNDEGRGIPLSLRAIEALKSLPRSTSGAVFPTTAEAIKLSWQRAKARARSNYETECRNSRTKPGDELFRDLHFHDLRHEAISRLFEGTDLDVMEIARITGHRTLSMLSRYTHLRAHYLVQRLDGVARGQVGDPKKKKGGA